MGKMHKGAAAGLAPAYSFSAYVAEVDVDIETGRIKVEKVWAAHDCGKALNPLSVEGQIIGSCHMGLGQVISEEMQYGRTGNLLNPDQGTRFRQFMKCRRLSPSSSSRMIQRGLLVPRRLAKQLT